LTLHGAVLQGLEEARWSGNIALRLSKSSCPTKLRKGQKNRTTAIETNKGLTGTTGRRRKGTQAVRWSNQGRVRRTEGANGPGADKSTQSHGLGEWGRGRRKRGKREPRHLTCTDGKRRAARTKHATCRKKKGSEGGFGKGVCAGRIMTFNIPGGAGHREVDPAGKGKDKKRPKGRKRDDKSTAMDPNALTTEKSRT